VRLEHPAAVATQTLNTRRADSAEMPLKRGKRRRVICFLQRQSRMVSSELSKEELELGGALHQ